MTSGIYRIQNKINQKIYIGSSMNIEERINLHFSKLRNGSHYNSLLQKEFITYGEANFIYDVIEVITDKYDALETEWDWIEYFKSNIPGNGYNYYTRPTINRPGYEMAQFPSQIVTTIQQIAFELGYIQTRGVGTGKVGSMAQLMQAIARGEIKLEKEHNDVCHNK